MFGLKQEKNKFENKAIIVTINSLFLISALLYLGAISNQRMKIKTILLGYVLLAVLSCCNFFL